MNHTLPTTALVLGGGGSAGNAWLIGVLAGLSDAGLDLSTPGLTVGTSAGATTAAQLTVASPTSLYAAALAAVAPPARPGARGGMSASAVSEHMDRTSRIIAAASDPADLRRRLGAAALELEDASERWRTVVAGRLPGAAWPDPSVRRVLITAVDARTGDPAVFDGSTGIDLVDAVAASTSSGAAYRIGDGRYIDGGYRRNENADLATGCDRVLVLSPLGGRTRTPLAWGNQLAVQVDELRAAGSVVQAVLPDEASLAAFGDNMMDLSARPAAARAGFRQGTTLAADLAPSWTADHG
ncbi:patatin-like phospholipase family protein [Cellulomonas sp. HZM]|uniref:patatin-like phospholipase family protein n=1 Tax=Cellulomonas sp. HZM TaxID=1454010 RepID=UPI00068F8CC9|nr:patatin-like phospholipase family protein [Cellulomonas sp. HZM]